MPIIACWRYERGPRWRNWKSTVSCESRIAESCHLKMSHSRQCNLMKRITQSDETLNTI